MTINLSSKDHRALDVTLDTILQALVDEEISLLGASGALAHVITAAAIGNEAEVRGWLRPETVARWKSGVAATD